MQQICSCLLFILLIKLSSGDQNFQWISKLPNYASDQRELDGHIIAVYQNISIVTQCSMRCLKNPRCQSYNFNQVQKICYINNESHEKFPNDMKPANNVQYFTKDAFSINQNADPCLSNPCMNEATCISMLTSDNTKAFLCICSLKWTGLTCNKEADSLGWSEWGSWSICSSSCGDGIRNRKRTCLDQTKQTEQVSQLCYGHDQEQNYCMIKECPIWTQWSDWSQCSTINSCGQGFMVRQRYCSNGKTITDCFGLNNETKVCNSITCDAPVSMTEIDNTFGNGYIKLYDVLTNQWLRFCADNWTKTNADVACKQMGFISGAFANTSILSSETQNTYAAKYLQCTGNEAVLATCPHFGWYSKSCSSNLIASVQCIVDGQWSSWTTWSSCSVTCATGFSSRSRLCNSPSPQNGGKMCSAENQESKLCVNKPCPVNGMWGEWTDWNKCNATCNGGRQTRTRSCNVPLYGGENCDGSSTEQQDCNQQLCPVDGIWKDWSSWSSCNATCGIGIRVRNRVCTGPYNGGQPCNGQNSSSEPCNDIPCPVDSGWSDWSGWSKCPVTCGSGQQSRYRICSASAGVKTCEGSATLLQDCSMGPCPVPGEWNAWSAWSSCSSTCGQSGKRIRKRSCDMTYNVMTLPCVATNSINDTDTKNCNGYSCTPTAKSCQELFGRGLEDSSFVTIDLSSSSTKLDPFTVYCQLNGTEISTIIHNNFENLQVFQSSGNYALKTFAILYGYNMSSSISINQLITLIDQPTITCKQYISYQCYNSPINSNSLRLIYWENRYSEAMGYWGNTNNILAGSTKNMKCNCGDTHPCGGSFLCACDQNQPTWNEDNGWLITKADLPVTKFIVTDSGNVNQQSKFIVGPIICIN